MSSEHPYLEEIANLEDAIQSSIAAVTNFDTANEDLIQHKIMLLATLAINQHYGIEDESEDETPEVLMEDMDTFGDD